MIKLTLLVIALFCCFCQPVQAFSKKKIKAKRVTHHPQIDGILNEDIWKYIPVAGNFVQMDPNNGMPSNYRTEAKFIYTDNSLIVGVMMYDDEPEKILKQLSKRDDLNNSDYALLLIDPFNNGLDAFEFIVTPMGVQIDAKVIKGSEDTNWDGVWKSGAYIGLEGWSVEFEIPYSALRFPQKDVQEWGLNIIRNIQRKKEKVSWNFIDKEESGWVSQSGILKGINNIKPPTRLSFSPYFSVYVDKSSDNSSFETNYRGGLDLKYGLNESFTLDMMLIPDFGQVQSDDQVLNLSPYETKFSEKRQYFTEATELFNRGGVFYSKRIGATPKYRYDVEDNLEENEMIQENPAESKIINSTKISGRTSSGLGIGFLNSMIRNTYAKIKDTISGSKRKFKTQAFANYNMFVLDQSLKNESYISLINTNVTVPKDDFIANVSGTEFLLKGKTRKYQLSGKALLSQRYEKGEHDEIGHHHRFSFEKISGKFNWNFSNEMISDEYDPNDFGYLSSNNIIKNKLKLGYHIYKPQGIFLAQHNSLTITHETQYSPARFSRFTIYYNSSIKLKSYNSLGIYGNVRPTHNYDFYEPRVEGMKLRKESSAYMSLWFSTDYRKEFALDLEAKYGARFSTDDLREFALIVKPRYRFNDKFTMEYRMKWNRQLNDIGYVSDEVIDDITNVYIGYRNTTYVESRLSSSYIFNNKMSLSFRARHYWAKAEYKNFGVLMDNGRLASTDYSDNHDINFNTFNIDVVYSWRFAPGSELAMVWKNSISDYNDVVAHSFVKNFKDTFDATQFNSLSVKLLYYIDYMSLKKRG
ncbi:DUF5916 domain-containing protein [Ancylomarina sp. 16SWW S1-10-2]|uniref:DUF5916 domain-containing protein n=1 Tax=Ancylomarina sp. 16SWW S1-10-2 TaxID=2499681 RepID=UPI0012AD90A1|nr:DUF5916 domain-containing protein [Ancylomarina sp. 16SWW S1-10-2]MRT94089.1 hypothetical protein [Ancylomarina sp. 16SWW S1-10-2]